MMENRSRLIVPVGFGAGWCLLILAITTILAIATVQSCQSQSTIGVGQAADHRASNCEPALPRSEGQPEGCAGNAAVPAHNRRQSDGPNGIPSSRSSPTHPASQPWSVRPSAAVEPRESNSGFPVSGSCETGTNRTEILCTNRRATPRNINNSGQPGQERVDVSMKMIAGRVLTQDGAALANVRIFATASRLFPADGQSGPAPIPARYESVTDSTGNYVFRDLPDGEYTVRTGAYQNYKSSWITVRAGVRYADLVLEEQRTVHVRGQVLSDEGYPLEGVAVLPVLLGQGSVNTDGEGRYRLPVAISESTSSAMVRFQLPGFSEETVKVPIAQSQSGQEVSADVVMTAVREWTAVTGTVASSEGSVLSDRQVRLWPIGHNQTYSAVTDGKGRFLFPAVEAGQNYRLQVTGAPDHQDHDARVRITVEDSNFPIIVDPYEFGKVSGQMVNRDGVPVPNFHLSLRHSGASSPAAIVSSDPSGNFLVDTAPAGELIFASESTPSILVRGIRLRQGDALDVPLVLDWGSHEIRGLVLDRYGNPAPASKIVLKWSHEQDGIRSSSTRRAAADAQGNFLFSQIGPGAHRVEVHAPGYRAVTLDHDPGRDGYELLVRLN